MSWATDLLASIGAPATPQNLAFLSAWSQEEGANSYNNPLNITGPSGYGGSTGWFNSAHVLEFPSEPAGIAATTNFLNHGYTSVINALRSGDPTSYFSSNPSAASDFSSGWSYGVGGVEKLLKGGNVPPIGGTSSAPSPLETFGNMLFPLAHNPLTTKDPQTGLTPGQSAQVPSWLAELLQPFSEWWKAHPVGLLLVALFVTIIGIAFITTDKNVSGVIRSGGKAAALA